MSQCDGAGVSQRLPGGGKEGSMAEDGLSALRPQPILFRLCEPLSGDNRLCHHNRATAY